VLVPVNPQGAKQNWEYAEDSQTGDLWDAAAGEPLAYQCPPGKWRKAEMAAPSGPSAVDHLVNLQAPLRTCRRCGNAIIGNARMTAEQVAARTLERYGEQMCATCGIMARNGIEVGEVEGE
jgi:hypothetical protein